MPIRIVTSKKNTGLDSLDDMYIQLRNALVDHRSDKYIAWRIKTLNNTILKLQKGVIHLHDKNLGGE